MITDKYGGLHVFENSTVGRLLQEIVDGSIEAVKPSTLFERGFYLYGNRLDAFGKELDLDRYKNIKCIAIGKSAEAMTYEIEKKLGNNATGIIASPVEKHFEVKGFRFFKTGHPFPDRESVDAAGEIISSVSSCAEKDLLIFLISGGGSAAAFLPVSGVSLSEVNETLKLLFDNGFPIDKINLVRRHLSQVGGGKLAALSPESEKMSLIISDVIGDDLPSIASGLSIEDPTTPIDAFAFLEGSGLMDRVPKSIPQILLETGKSYSKVNLKNNYVKIIASNVDAMSAAQNAGIKEGFSALVLTRFLDLNTQSAADLLVSIARSIGLEGKRDPTLILLGGETTVKITGSGTGGRNQQLVLEALYKLAKLPIKLETLGNLIVFSFGTDGKDGNSDAAGAYASVDVLKRVENGPAVVEKYISENDSYSFFAKYGGLIMTGPTDTNVMDIMGIIAE